ncbi:MAG: hypothetical protein DMF98_21005 [Acidobacteria bacterium]|nr:MAG: hypothetical protein DMF98_21005 [Acidobacteriota bacterium]
MDATRTRLSFAGDWLMAAAFLVGTVLVTLLIVRELRGAGAIAPSSVTTTPAAIPAEAVSVPALAMGEARELRVGDRQVDALERLGQKVILLSKITERGPLGDREVRSYQLAGTRFILVLEPFERGGEPRVAGIYLQ